MLDAHLAEVGEGHAEELAQLEAALRERAQAIAATEREVVRREAIVRELVLALEDAGALEAVASHGHVPSRVDDEVRAHLDRAISENEQLRTKLDALALDVARREGELQARGWRIAALEERVASLEARPPPPPPVAPSEKKGAIPASGDLTELQALRQALGQEHEARVRAESGEELQRARADLARQATLLEQLSRELESRDRSRVEPPHGAGQEGDPAQT